MNTLQKWEAAQRAANPLWPWPDQDGDGVVWPQPSERSRLGAYSLMEKAYDGDHWAAFEQKTFASLTSAATAERNYVAMNYVRVATREVIRIFSGSELDVASQNAAVQAIAETCDANTLVRDIMRDRMRLGDAAVLIRRLADETVSCELLDPTITFPIAAVDSRTTLAEVRVAYEISEDQDQYVYLVAHQPRQIVHSLWQVDQGRLVARPFSDCPYAAAMSGAQGDQTSITIPTPTEELTVVWSPRDPQGDLIGQAMCQDALTPQRLLNRRETQRDTVLTAYDDPMLVVNEADTQQEIDSAGEPTGRSVFRLSASEVIIRESDENIPPPTWIDGNPHLDANEQAQDDARRAFAMMAGISISSITQDSNAQAAPSGESLRMQFLPTVLTAEEEAREACLAIGQALRIGAWWATGTDPGEVECTLAAAEHYQSQGALWPTPTGSPSGVDGETQQIVDDLTGGPLIDTSLTPLGAASQQGEE